MLEEDAYRAREISDDIAVSPNDVPSYDELRVAVPWHLKGKPYHVQLAALAASRGRKGFGHYLEQGLGKTATGLNEFVDLYRKGTVDIMVVIAPPTFMYDWEQAVTEWMPDPMPACSWPTDPRVPKARDKWGRRTVPMPSLQPPFLFAINWEMTRQPRGQEILEYLCNTYRVFMLQDETSYIKNVKSGTAKGTLEVAKLATVLRGLNGTPLTQAFTDIYSQYRCLGLWNGQMFHPWKNRYAKLGGFMGKKIVGVKPEKVQQFKQEVGQHCFRAMKRDWTDLPPKLYKTRTYRMTQDQAHRYYEMQEEFLTTIGEADIEADMAISQRTKLQQIGSGFAMDDKGVAHRIMPADKNPKLLAVLEDARLCPGKFLIPRHFQESGFLLMEAFEAEGFRMMHLHGGMMKEDLFEMKREFNENDDIDGMVLSLSAGRMGHTLLGTSRRRCADMFFFENVYNLLSRLQIEDRNHRHGQDSDAVRYADYVGCDQERDIAEALQKKIDMTDVLINSIRAVPTGF